MGKRPEVDRWFAEKKAGNAVTLIFNRGHVMTAGKK